jgi:CBS domain-containing protein
MLKRVKDVMTHGVETIRPDDTIQAAARRMGELDIGPLPVVEDQVVVGILTDRDITVRAVAEGRDPTRTTVRETMSPQLVCCQAEEDLLSAVQRMEECEVRRLPVIDRNNHLVGMVALADVARSSGDAITARALKGVSQPS